MALMKKTGYFMLLFLAGMIVFFTGGYWASMTYVTRTVIKIALPCLMLILTWACGRYDTLRRWRGVSLSFLAASSGFLCSWLFSDPILGLLGVMGDSVSGIALTKFVESFLIVVPVILIAFAGGMLPGDIFLCRGRLGAWLIIGLVSFTVFVILFLLQEMGRGLTAARLLALAPWILIFIFSNAFTEELHFRGLFLKPFEKLLGRHGSVFCIAAFFTLVHAPVKYTPDVVQFLAILFVLSLAWGYVVQRTESLWGSVLFHAGADLMIIIGIYENFGAFQQ
jgi:membrane protease YdiL (CAAX protease family)